MLCASGCFGPMYNPNGPWGAPGYSQYGYPGYGQPGMGTPGTFQTQTPGAQYTPGTIDSGSNIGPTPTYNNGSGLPAGSGSNVPVPQPVDSGTPYFQPQPAGASLESSENAPPFSAIMPAREESLASSASPANGDGPVLRPAGMSRVQPPADATAYRHDEASYTWLEGVVSYDPADRTWNIVYSLNPTESDQYAGHFTLSPSPLLRTFREGERVRLEGRVDSIEKDRFGKSTYLPERIIRHQA